MIKAKIKGINHLCLKMEKKEQRRLRTGKEVSNAYALLRIAFENIQVQSSFLFRDYIFGEYKFCEGFLRALSVSHYITKEEYEALSCELSSAYQCYLNRAECEEKMKRRY